MGNTSPCCFRQPNNATVPVEDCSQSIVPCCFREPNNTTLPAEDGSQSLVPSNSHHPIDNLESSSGLSIESIQHRIQQENTTEQIDELIKMLEDVLSKIEGEGDTVSTSSSEEVLASPAKYGREFVDAFSKDAENIPDMDIISQGLKSAATNVLNVIGGAHYMFLGFSLLAYTVNEYLKMKRNDSACKEHLKEVIELTKDVKKFIAAVPGQIDKVRKAIHDIFVESVKCRVYISRGKASRVLVAGIMETHLQTTKEIFQNLRGDLTLAAGIHVVHQVSDMQRQIPTHFQPDQSESLGCHPEDIDQERVNDVKNKLDLGGSDQALAVVLVGHGGIGKTTLATSVTQSLKLSFKDFKFSTVTIDQKKSEKQSHIVKLQSDIIFHFTGNVTYLENAEQGQKKLREAMANKSCFLYIDNVVDSYYIKELLPQNPLQDSEQSAEDPQMQKTKERSAEDPQMQKTKERSAEDPQMQKTKEKSAQDSEKTKEKSAQDSGKTKEKSAQDPQNTKIRILITSRQDDLKPLFKIKNVVYDIAKLSHETSINILRRTILQGGDTQYRDYEENMINELANACGGIPLLLSVLGNFLKDNREEKSYEEAIKALKKGNIDGYGPGYEELLSERLMFVYDQMKNAEAQEAFLDICTFFHGRPWDLVADIVDSTTLQILSDKKLVEKKEGTVIVHDILRSMGAEKAKDTRLMNYEEFFHINDDESKLKNVKGMVLVDRTFLATLNTTHLNAMRQSLRFLVLGDWVRLDGPPCERAFTKLRYLQVGDLRDFPFKNVSKMEKLNFFLNSSMSGMELAQLPPSLKRLCHQIPYEDCNEVARLPLQNLNSLKNFSVQSKKSVRLPQRFKLPPSLERLDLNSCQQLPKSFSHLSALQTLTLNKCGLKRLPVRFTQSVQLRSLSMQHCTNMISIPNNIFASLCSLRDLDLTGSTSLKMLPADFGSLIALENLNIQDCQNLRVLPESFGELKALKTLALNGCISLERLPDSFGTLLIEHLTLQSLPTLERLPDSFVKLSKLKALNVKDCINLRALPKSFEELCSLKKITLLYCPSLTRLPDGFEALIALEYMELRDCRSLVDLPACFEMLSCLEALYLEGLFFSRLPDGLGQLKKLKILYIRRCCKFQTLPPDFENLEMENLYLSWCPMLEETTMDKIVKLQNCRHADITHSGKLIERWNKMEERESVHINVRSLSFGWDREEWVRARRAGLLCGHCLVLDSTTPELHPCSSISIPTNTTLVVISLQLDQCQLFKPIVDMGQKRATRDTAGELRIIYVCRRSDGSDAPSEEDEKEEIRQTLMRLPRGISYAIPSTDIRRLSFIGANIFDDPNVFNDGTGPQLLCFMAKVMVDAEGHQIFIIGEILTKDEIEKNEDIENSDEKAEVSKKETEISDEEAEVSAKETDIYDEEPEISEEETEISDEEDEISDGIVEFINCICENETKIRSGQCPRLLEGNIVGQFIQKLKSNKIGHFLDKKGKVEVAYLHGKTVAIILIDQNYPECTRLQQMYGNFKLKYSNFEAIWIPIQDDKDLGFGTYSRATQCMPWLTLADPKLIKTHDIEDKSPRVIIINRGSIDNPNALSHLMSWGADACPFTKGSLSQLDLKSSLQILFHSTKVKELNNKVIFLYSEPPSHKLKMKMNCTLKKLMQINGEGNYEIVYVGRFFGRNVGESLQKAYEDATESMNWTKLSFEDMMTFWYRCKYLSDEGAHGPNSAPTLERLLKALLDEERWLVVLDGDGMVTANGIDVAEMACDEMGIVMKDLTESLKEGKCIEAVTTFLRDEIQHGEHDHPLRLLWKESPYTCDRCLVFEPAAYGKRFYLCEGCDWGICSDCWKEFVKQG